MLTLKQASSELHELMHGEKTRWWYAFAMGNKCQNGTNEIFESIRLRDSYLRAIIKEHSLENQ